MENEYLIESARQMRREIGRENVVYIHVSLLPYIGASKELKTKPTQHAVRTLMSYGINPDFLVLRADLPIPEDILKKAADFCSLDREHIIAAPNMPTIYEVPLDLEHQGVRERLLSRLGFEVCPCDLGGWRTLVEGIHTAREIVKIGMVGKYNDLEDAYYSLNE